MRNGFPPPSNEAGQAVDQVQIAILLAAFLIWLLVRLLIDVGLGQFIIEQIEAVTV